MSSGFTVQYIFPRILYISWLTPQYMHQVKQLTEPNRSQQARLLPPTVKGHKTKPIQTVSTNISIDPPLNTLNNIPKQTTCAPTKIATATQRKTTKNTTKKNITVQGKSIAEFKANGRCVLDLT